VHTPPLDISAQNMRQMVLMITPLIDMVDASSPAASHFGYDCINLLKACKCFFDFLGLRGLLFSFSAFAAAYQKDNDRRNYNDNKYFIRT
jgi:hypothetical protein